MVKKKMHPLLYNLRRGIDQAPPSPPESDADVLAFNAATGTNEPAIETLTLSLKSAGLWSKLTNIYPFVGGTGASHAINLRNAGAQSLTFSPGATHSASGYATNNTSEAFAPVTAVMVGPTRSFSIGVMTSSRVASDTCKDVESNGTGTPGFYGYDTTGRSFTKMMTWDPSVEVALPMNHSYMVSHGPAYNMNFMIGSTLAGNCGLAAYQDPDSTVWKLGEGSPNTYSFYFCGTEMSVTEMQSLYAILATFQATLGRS